MRRHDLRAETLKMISKEVTAEKNMKFEGFIKSLALQTMEQKLKNTKEETREYYQK